MDVNASSGVLPILNEVLVTIAVKNRKLSYYPRRDNDVIAFYKDANKGSPEKPSEVRWLALGLAQDLYIKIKAKTPGTGIFKHDEFDIPVGSNTVKSGPPTKSPAKGEDLNWPYSITLMDSKGEVDTIDPMVIIKNDP